MDNLRRELFWSNTLPISIANFPKCNRFDCIPPQLKHPHLGPFHPHHSTVVSPEWLRHGAAEVVFLLLQSDVDRKAVFPCSYSRAWTVRPCSLVVAVGPGPQGRVSVQLQSDMDHKAVFLCSCSRTWTIRSRPLTRA